MMVIIVISVITITIIIDLNYFIVVSLFLTTLILYFSILFTLSRTMIKREGYFKDQESLFNAGEGEMIIFDGSPIAKLLSITNERIHYSQYKSMAEMRQMLKLMAITMIISPTLSFIIYVLIYFYKSYPYTSLQLMFWVTIIIFVALIIVFFIFLISIKFEGKKDPVNFCTIQKTRNGRINFQLFIMPRALVKNPRNKIHEFEIDPENLGLITIGSIIKELEKSDNIFWFLRFLFKLTKALVKYPTSLRIDLNDPNVTINSIPDYKTHKEIKSALIVASTDNKFAPEFLEHLKIWVNN